VKTALAIFAGFALALAGCAGSQQSMMDAAGPQSGRVEARWWLFFWLMLAIFVTVIAVMLWALMRRQLAGPLLGRADLQLRELRAR
jgi:heme/copper-type cytochrome/quinol oxidase subunit 2